MQKPITSLHNCLLVGLAIFMQQAIAESYPEQSLVDNIVSKAEPDGVAFLVMEHDEEALQWVIPRVTHYVRQLRKKWHDLPIVVLSHGDEMFALQSQYETLYASLHEGVRSLVEDYDVLFQVCGSYAYLSDIDASAFPRYVDVVPFAPAEIDNYRQMEYRIINLELTW